MPRDFIEIIVISSKLTLMLAPIIHLLYSFIRAYLLINNASSQYAKTILNKIEKAIDEIFVGLNFSSRDSEYILYTVKKK